MKMLMELDKEMDVLKKKRKTKHTSNENNKFLINNSNADVPRGGKCQRVLTPLSFWLPKLVLRGQVRCAEEAGEKKGKRKMKMKMFFGYYNIDQLLNL